MSCEVTGPLPPTTSPSSPSLLLLSFLLFHWFLCLVLSFRFMVLPRLAIFSLTFHWLPEFWKHLIFFSFGANRRRPGLAEGLQRAPETRAGVLIEEREKTGADEIKEPLTAAR